MRVYRISGEKTGLRNTIASVGCDPAALPVFGKKSEIIPVMARGIKQSVAVIIKQEMISSKGDAAIHREAITAAVEKTDMVLLGTVSVYEDFIRKARAQGYPTLDALADEVEMIIARGTKEIETMNFRGKTLAMDRPRIMGIVNITPDSFYDGGRYKGTEEAMTRCREIIEQGADIVDIGGESTRPGSEPVSLERELERVVPVIEKAAQDFDAIISVDTYKAAVAEEALRAGAHIVNDISGLGYDPEMPKTIARYQAGAVIMHIKGTPKDMQKDPVYEDIIAEMNEYFAERVALAKKHGIPESGLMIDPGIGFGKRLEHNIAILANLEAFKIHGLPIAVGASRKSMIGMLVNREPEQRLWGTMGAHVFAYINGANIIRAHDVKEHYDMLGIIDKMKNYS
ncbi:MAG: dihydropteroate synthase [Brevinematales bacterium]|nr:dihydropteroate synthase [Brevinematales bacterium]